MEQKEQKKQDVNSSGSNAGGGVDNPKEGKDQKKEKKAKKTALLSGAEPSEEKRAIALEAERILAEHSEAESVYMTSDGFGYFSEHDARNHARDLKDGEVTQFKQKEHHATTSQN